MAGSSKDSGYVDNWQAMKTVTECNRHMLTSEDCSDVIFRVGSEKHVVRAHRYVLVSRSCVFHAMLCGPLAEKGEVTIPDIEHEVFREFLQFLYTDSVNITGQNVVGLLYIARKYAVDTLLCKCATFLKNSLTEENACQILEQCHGYNEADVEEKALKILTEASEKILKSHGFKELCPDCLDKFLKSDDLKLKEESVFEAVLSWVKHQCLKESVTFNGKSISKFLGDKKYEIRFESLPLDYIAAVVGPSELLSGSERLRIMDSKLRSNMDISPFSSKKRTFQASLRYVCRYNYVSQESQCSSGCHACSFSCNKAVTLVGCQLLGPKHLEKADYAIVIQLKYGIESVTKDLIADDCTVLNGEDYVNDIIFHEAIELNPKIRYKLCVNFLGPDMSCGEEDDILTANSDGVTFAFRSLQTAPFLFGLIFTTVE